MQKRLIVHGIVQGVGYRAWSVRTATAIGLVGWVRNLDDGRVEILAQGAAEQLAKLEELCRVGPTHAQVSIVECFEFEGEELQGDFRVK